MATYSIGTKGAIAGQPFATKIVTIDDVRSPPAGQQRAMMLNGRILCQNPDLSQSEYKIDAERSDPSKGLIFLLPV